LHSDTIAAVKFNEAPEGPFQRLFWTSPGSEECQHMQGTTNTLPYTINFSGNCLTLYPPFVSVYDYPGAAVGIQDCSWANVFGNTLISAGHGVAFGSQCGNAVIMNNNFANATYRGIGIGEYGGTVESVSIFNNILGSGSTFHVQLPFTNSFNWFLNQNIYLNAFTNSVPPFLDPAASAVHLN